MRTRVYTKKSYNNVHVKKRKHLIDMLSRAHRDRSVYMFTAYIRPTPARFLTLLLAAEAEAMGWPLTVEMNAVSVPPSFPLETNVFIWQLCPRPVLQAVLALVDGDPKKAPLFSSRGVVTD